MFNFYNVLIVFLSIDQGKISKENYYIYEEFTRHIDYQGMCCSRQQRFVYHIRYMYGEFYALVVRSVNKLSCFIYFQKKIRNYVL